MVKLHPDARMTVELLAEHYPLLYHMAEENSWSSIQKHGLLSTTALLDLFGYTGEERERIESERRPTSIAIEHPELGRAVIRDNIPMRESALEKALVGVTPRSWYELLNGRVFFWLTESRLNGLLGARAYRKKRHTILTVDTSRLLARHAPRISLSPINSGSTLYNAPKRGLDTFSRIGDYPIGHWRQRRTWAQAIVELAVDYAVPDIRDLVVNVEHVRGADERELLYARPEMPIADSGRGSAHAQDSRTTEGPWQ